MSDSPLERFRRAQAEILAGRPGEALALLDALAADEQLALFDGAAGVALQMLGRHHDAIARFRSAIEVERGQLAGLHYNLGVALAAVGQLDDAVAAYEDALALQPALQVAMVNLGVVRQSQGRSQDAEVCFRAALAQEPDDGNARYNLGAVLCALGRFAEAAVELGAVLEVAGAPAGLGAALAAQGKHADAVEAYRRAVAQEPGSVEAHRGLATALLMSEQRDDALTAATRAVAMAPDDALACDILGACLANVGRHREAVAAFRGAMALAPDNAGPCSNLATILDRLDDPAGALDAYAEALARDPEHRASRIGRAAALARLGRTADAIAAYHDLLVREPDNPGWRHMVDAQSGANPAAPPVGYIAQVFDSYATKFERHLVDDLAYRVPALLREALAGHGPFAAALDLGCGTGLVGAALRDRVDVLHGVDLSPKMLDEARAKAIYEELAVDELVAYLDAAATPRYALIVAGDVLCYLGDLAPLFAAARRRLAPGGVLAFTVEVGDDADFCLRAGGRYAHGRGYLERLAADAGLTIDSCARGELRREHAEPVLGWVCVMVG